MPLSGNSSSTDLRVELEVTFEPDSSRFRRLAQLLFTPSTDLIVGVSS